MKIFLDDIREPSDCAKYMHARIGKLNPIYLDSDWHIVRDYSEFVRAIIEYAPNITHVSFDHDLADEHYNIDTWKSQDDYKEKTGYECARFLKDHYKLHGWTLPVMFVHSMNPVGTQNIINLFKSSHG